MEFLNILESFDQRKDWLQSLGDTDDGFTRVGALRRNTPRYFESLTRTAEFMADIFEGRRHPHQLQEAMTSDDFSQLFGDVLDRQTLAIFATWPVHWPAIARRSTIADFRTVKRFPPPIGANNELGALAEKEAYPTVGVTEQAPITYSVAKYGRTMGFSWEALINDDLDLLKDAPRRFAEAAQNTRERKITQLYVGASGPSASVYTAGNTNIINTTNGASATNPALSISGLQDGFIVLGNMTQNGEPIMNTTVTLVVPPALEVTAQNVLNAMELRLNEAGGTANSQLITANWIRNRLSLVVNPFIPLIATTANGSTSWFLFGSPNSGRPALEMGLLRGKENPELFMKSPNQIRVGGGLSSPMDGSFETDQVEWKVRDCHGQVVVEPLSTVASNGSGS